MIDKPNSIRCYGGIEKDIPQKRISRLKLPLGRVNGILNEKKLFPKNPDPKAEGAAHLSKTEFMG
jgi:hypothetical protein